MLAIAFSLVTIAALAGWGWAFRLHLLLLRLEAELAREQDVNRVMDNWISELSARHSGERPKLQLLEQPLEPPPLPRAPTLLVSQVLWNRLTGAFELPRYKIPGDDE